MSAPPSAVVTGGATGIGAAVVDALTAAGHPVTFTYRASGQEARALARAVRSRGGAPCLPVRCDVTRAEDVDGLFTRAEEEFGPPGVLVCAAGALFDASVLDMTSEQWQDALDVNLTSVFRCVRRAAMGMVRARRGRIVVLGSVAAVTGAAGQANYAAAKAGLIGLVRSVATELAPRGITCNLVLPGPVDTAILAHLPERRKAELAASTALRRFGEPAEVAAAAVFLASDAASYITGVVLPADGGLTMGRL
ncbi:MULTISPECIES: SDR family NAD(P)-dependent oxidoreductase [unclassified Streptomyces]|uniref:SDR family NAD(P)-dependent oxidoreductase n=1 Tax=unclassified Streptomyces TaxID=2593676 RepID=UPI0016605CF3|nr:MULTISPECIES: 3-oxoacyl-ACP reductase FabG [unclassified Streptomyces]MBD0711212.1 hypothetical protein [Streptomyces sp. CBMA291]MBD0714243.1 hypothetical protein [Streptomyces sp. CBMA370]